LQKRRSLKRPDSNRKRVRPGDPYPDAGHPTEERGYPGEAGKEIFVPYPAGRMKAWPVSSRVNSPKNNDPEIIVPVEIQSVLRSKNSLQLL
jgi:hypothetical protein